MNLLELSWIPIIAFPMKQPVLSRTCSSSPREEDPLGEWVGPSKHKGSALGLEELCKFELLCSGFIQNEKFLYKRKNTVTKPLVITNPLWWAHCETWVFNNNKKNAFQKSSFSLDFSILLHCSTEGITLAFLWKMASKPRESFMAVYYCLIHPSKQEWDSQLPSRTLSLLAASEGQSLHQIL